MSDLIERLLDNAATCSQERGMLDDGALRECVKLNVAEPLADEIERLTNELRETRAVMEGNKWIEAGTLCERVDGVEYARLIDGRWQCLVCPPDSTFMKDAWSENDSLPIAIIDACNAALANKQETDDAI